MTQHPPPTPPASSSAPPPPPPPTTTARRPLHLHVGLPKTGTTYLQGCLLALRGWFAERGYDLAPMSDGMGAHHPLAFLLRDAGAQAAAAVLRAAAAQAPPGRGLVASSEVFSGVMTDPALARAFAAALAPDFDVTVHVTLRRPDRLRESAYAEMARFHARLGPPDPAPQLTGTPAADGLYRNASMGWRLNVFAEAFGEDALRVSVYHDVRRRDPLAAFCAGLGLEAPPPPELSARHRNDALPRRKTLMIAAFRKTRRRCKRMVFEALRDSPRIADDGIKTLLSPAARRAIVEAEREDNRGILARWGPVEDGGWLLEPPEEEPGWFPAASPRMSEFAGLWLDLMRAALGSAGRRPLGRLRDAVELTELTIGAARKSRRDHRPV